MNEEEQIAIPYPDEEPDDPYIHTVPTEEFVETVERASQETNDDWLTPDED